MSRFRFDEHSDKLLYLKLQNNEVKFQQFVEVCKKRNELWKLISRSRDSLFKKLIASQLLTKEDIKAILDTIDTHYEVAGLLESKVLLRFVAEQKMLQELGEAIKRCESFHSLLQQTELFQYVLDRHLISADDAEDLLSLIDSAFEVDCLAKNTCLLKYLYEQSLVDKWNIDVFNELLSMYNTFIDELMNKNFFDFVEFYETHCYNKNYEYCEKDTKDVDYNLLNLNDFYKYTYTFEHLTFDERSQLFDEIKNDESAKDKVLHIVDAHLESTFSSLNELLKYLKKKEKKQLLNI